MEPTLGAIVQVQLGRGVVRFVGSTSFQVGKWIGIELDEDVSLDATHSAARLLIRMRRLLKR